MDHNRRIAALRRALQKKGIDSFITMHPANVRYLTGFTGSNALFAATPAGTFVLTDFRYKEQIAIEVTAGTSIVGQGSLVDLASKKKIFSGAGAVAFEKHRLSVAQHLDLSAKCRRNRLIGTDGIVEAIRSVKDEEELAFSAEAIAITDKVFQKILGILKPGIRELEISAEISYLHKKFGAEKDAFDTIVASGRRGAFPHGTASAKRIEKGEFVTLDFGCIVNGYHSDMTRTVSIGAPSSEMKAVYTVVLDAQKKGLDAISAGMKAKDVDAAARGHIAKKGYGAFFGHSLGHGVGLEIHEPLRLAGSNRHPLRVGNLVTVEPGIYLPKKFGVRIEDMVIVRSKGCEIITSSPKELIVL